jgi:hypothetical protein
MFVAMRVPGITARRVAAALLAAAALSIAPVAHAVTVRDAAGRNVDVKDASRIVSVGGAVTEILYALGLADRIVAVDSTSLFPAEALKQKPNVGYMRALSAEGVLGLNPSLVLAIEGSGPKETIAVLEAATVPLVRVPDRHDVRRHRREDQDGGKRCRRTRSRRGAGVPGQRRSRGTRNAARDNRQAKARDVRAVVPQRQADGGGARHRG